MHVTVLGFNMLKIKTKNFFNKYDLLKPQNNIMVAVSGGVDSLCLLFVVYHLSLEYHFNLFAVHVNHQWRGEESFEDEQFVEQYCEHLHIPVFIRRLDKGLPANELLARNKRYEIFNTIAQEHNINIVLTAHTQSDQIETVLYRIIKGSGQLGLSGIPEMRTQDSGPTLYRPFLSCTREEIEEYSRNNNLQARIDSSNFDQTYLRNRVRHSLLPQLKTYNPQVGQALLRLSKISAQNEQIIEYFLEPLLKTVFEDNTTINIDEYLKLPEYLKPRLIMMLLCQNKIDYDYKMIERLLEYIEESQLNPCEKKYSLIKNLYLHITQKKAKIVSFEPTTVIQSTAKVAIPGITELKELNLQLQVSEYNKTENVTVEFPPPGSDKALVDLSKIQVALQLRTRRPGDIINPLGMNGHMKLKKYLINHHIPQKDKDSLPVVATENEVLWVVGVGLSDKIKVLNYPTHVFEIIRSNNDSD